MTKDMLGYVFVFTFVIPVVPFLIVTAFLR